MPAKKRLGLYFRDFGYKVIRVKYFIMIVVALILEITTLLIYLLKSESILDFELFTVAILYGITSSIIVILAIGVLILMKTDKMHDKNKIQTLQKFKRDYGMITDKYSPQINVLVNRFDTENSSIDKKIEYAVALEEKYNEFLEDFSNLENPSFLEYACRFENNHLSKEKDFYNGFSNFSKKDFLNDLSSQSEIAHTNFLRELNKLENNLRFIM
jgi:hypothetical protein